MSRGSGLAPTVLAPSQSSLSGQNPTGVGFVIETHRVRHAEGDALATGHRPCPRRQRTLG
eukprot:1929001-Pyramimonas_sp.AAC.1